MNILFLYDKNNKKFFERVDILTDYIKKNSSIYEIKLLSRVTQKTNCDIYLVISDSIDEINKYFEKIKDKKKILLLTSNVEATHILNCINITKNITYLGNKCEIILDRISKLYEETK